MQTDFFQKQKMKIKMVEGKKEVRAIMKRGGIDLAGTFIGITTSKTARERYTCYVREQVLKRGKKCMVSLPLP